MAGKPGFLFTAVCSVLGVLLVRLAGVFPMAVLVLWSR